MQGAAVHAGQYAGRRSSCTACLSITTRFYGRCRRFRRHERNGFNGTFARSSNSRSSRPKFTRGSTRGKSTTWKDGTSATFPVAGPGRCAACRRSKSGVQEAASCARFSRTSPR
jgi:hypothetical protein